MGFRCDEKGNTQDSEKEKEEMIVEGVFYRGDWWQ